MTKSEASEETGAVAALADREGKGEHIASALRRVVAAQGLEAVSLRRVAAEAGVTSGMVQHYFPSKDAMLDCALQAAAAGFQARMTAALAALGASAAPRDLVGAVLSALLPSDDGGLADGRVALAFMAHAATRPEAARRLEEGAAQLRDFIADQARAAVRGGEAAADLDPKRTAVAQVLIGRGPGLLRLVLGEDPGAYGWLLPVIVIAACAAVIAWLESVKRMR